MTIPCSESMIENLHAFIYINDVLKILSTFVYVSETIVRH
jgi:hypothetical protein